MCSVVVVVTIFRFGSEVMSEVKFEILNSLHGCIRRESLIIIARRPSRNL